MRPDVVAVIPTLDRSEAQLDTLLESLQSLRASGAISISVVRNNLAPRGSPILGADEVIEPGMNLGYVGSLELVRRSTDASFLWSIQDDMTVTGAVLGPLVSALHNDDRLGVASPLLVRDGVVPARTRAGVFDAGFPTADRAEWSNYPFLDTTVDELDVDHDFCFVSGSGAVYRTVALREAGGFNVDLFPLMHVDVDTCLRLREAGWGSALVASSHIGHAIGGSTPSILSRATHEANLPVVQDRSRTRARYPGVNPAVPLEMVAAIARRASFLTIDVARVGQSVAAEQNQKFAEALEYITSLESALSEKHAELADAHARIIELHGQVQSSSSPVTSMTTSSPRGATMWGRRRKSGQ